MTATKTPLHAWQVVAATSVPVVGIAAVLVLFPPAPFSRLLPTFPALTPGVTAVGSGDRSITPNRSAVFDLEITNHGGGPVSIDRLETTIRAIDAPASTPGSPCTIRDFVVIAPSSTLGIVVHPGTTRLSALDVPRAQWPTVGMADSADNQGGCSGATLELDFVLSVEAS
ncbi:hypothetical protein B0I08_10723 [Glaciihabitans tibetensis]|uniref:Uncharacterized protein n=1 Tax=Glaciihabitans tibetensis TaxID=1266600 RepID=A0A2T0VAB4_9MICO|nr:hypothetical protein [Glaciihabitans tibetensis]PRY67130.1 hypothetical protein B0I08_10723 [Glaciihabitans tibetensis]